MAVAAALCSAPLPVWAAGLGPLTVQSGLGQTLRAEVAITALGETDLASLSVGLASPEAFRKAGLEFNPALGSLRFAIEPRGDGGALVRVTSTQPVNEPFVDLMLELSWNSGKFVREYTFLLDPPELRLGQDTVVSGGTGQHSPAAVPSTVSSAPSAPSAVSQAASTAPVRESVAAETGTEPLPAAGPQAATDSVATTAAVTSAVPDHASASAHSPADRAGTVRVEAGDSASSIAARFKPADVTLEQAVIALYQANPDAFFGSVHQLFAGRDLSIPADDVIRAVDPVEARREVRAQVAAFEAWRSRLASSVPMVDAGAAGQSAAGAVLPPAPESAAAIDTGDRLELSRADAVDGGRGGATGEAAAPVAVPSEESQLAHEAALHEQQERVALLERNVADLQQLLELKNRQLAELQQQVEAADAAGTAVSGTVGANAADRAPAGQDGEAGVTGRADAEAVPASSGAVSASSDAVADGVPVPAAISDAPPTPEPAGSVAAADAGSTTVGGETPARTVDSTATDRPGAADSGPGGTEKTADAGNWIERLTGHPWAWPALIVIALGLAFFGLLTRRRRRQAADFEDSFTDVDAFATNSLFGTTGGQSIDTHASVFAPGAGAHVATAPVTEVDPVAEADVYIAYGREAQAEEILREALHNQPDRQAIRLKLLEIQAARRDVAAFAALAQEMHEQTGGANEEWPRVVALGRELDPDDPLYGGPRDPGPAAGFDSDGAGVASDAGADTLGGISYDGSSAVSSADAVTIDAPASRIDTSAYHWSAETDVAGSTLRAGMVTDSASATALSPEDAAVSEDTRAPDFDFDLEPEAETTVGRIGLEATGFESSSDGQDAEADPHSATGGSSLEQAIGGAFDLPTLDLADDVGTAQAAADVRQKPDEVGQASRAPADDALDFDIDLPTFGDLDLHDSRMERPAVDLAELDGDPETVGETDDFGLQTVEFDLSGVGDGFAAARSDEAPATALPRWQEMDTKLDLAAAYEEIGDKEGARELLQEVLEGGDAAQQDKARSMLTTIG